MLEKEAHTDFLLLEKFIFIPVSKDGIKYQDTLTGRGGCFQLQIEASSFFLLSFVPSPQVSESTEHHNYCYFISIIFMTFAYGCMFFSIQTLEVTA